MQFSDRGGGRYDGFVPLRPYDAVPYSTYPRIETHPDRLAAVGRLRGMSPAPVDTCRVLEIGCGDGGNLIPMAYFLPRSHFYGIDLAGAAVADGLQVIHDLKLRNIELAERDLRDLGRDDGEFDYILAHGLYSWLPAEVRDRRLAVCRERLAPHGIVYLSYNTWPGRHARQILREMLLYHLRNIRAPRRRIREARRFLRLIDTPEARELADRPDDVLFHDDLAPVNDPVWFRDFAAHAERHGLQYVGEAGPGARVPLDSEQYADFVRMRSFRQSVVCRAEVALDRDVRPERMAQLLFSAPGDPVDAVTAALRDAYPLPVPYEELVPYGADALFDHWRTGRVDAHVWDFPCEESVTERPRATRLARYQTARSNVVASVCHHLVELTDDDRELIVQLDGRRKRKSPRIEWFARMGLLDG
jgi:SAM-dependent methyltransferase